MSGHCKGNGRLSLEELQQLQRDAEKLQDDLEDLFRRAHEAIAELLERFLEKFKEVGLDLPQNVIDSIRRELRELRDKQRTITGLMSRVSVFKDLIELKKALIETSNSESVKRILTEQKIAEIILKNQVLIEILIVSISMLVEVRLLGAKLD
jgi:hypothetical protein